MPYRKTICQLLTAVCFGFVPGLKVENSQIPGYDARFHAFDYNRLRAQLNIDHDLHPNFTATVIVDNESYLKSVSGSLENRISLYRGYVEYLGENHSWIIGKQRIPLGVGQFWNPIDVFNPINIEAVEPDERPGTETIRYEYGITSLSNLDVNVAEGKGAIRVKGYLDFADIALLGLWDDDYGFDIIGWELEGELGTTGIELRSEGGSFREHQSGERHIECIIGAEYGFANSLTLSGEYYFIDVSGSDMLGFSARFRPVMLLSCSFTSVFTTDDGSGFVSPVIEYSLSDEMTLSGGLFWYFGSDTSLLGTGYDRVYLRWFINF